MKQSWGSLLFLIIILGGLLFPSISYGHILKTDGQIGAVIHIDPEDDPIVGQPSNIYFEFKDRENKFSASGCDCEFVVLKNGQSIFKTPLFGNSNEPHLVSSTISYTFPERNIYTVQVNGKAKDGMSFTNFSLDYDIRVERTSPIAQIENQEDSSKGFVFHTIHYVLLIGGLLMVIVVYLKRKNTR